MDRSVVHSFFATAMQNNYTAAAPARSVLLTIDVQQDFTDPGAVAEIPGTSVLMPVMRRVLEAYRQYRLPIVHVVRLLPFRRDECRSLPQGDYRERHRDCGSGQSGLGTGGSP
jgi:nicotinamidase-related amidase